MKIERANTEPYYRLLKFHEATGRHLRLAAGALQLVGKKPRRRKATRVTTVLPAGGEPWGKFTVWRDIASGSAIQDATKFLGQIGIMRSLSAFEDFLVGVEAEHARALAIARGDESEIDKVIDADEPKPQLSTVFDRLGWNIAPIRFLLPMFEYFVVARNCVAHRGSRASQQLIDQYEKIDFEQCAKRWPLRPKAKFPAFPALKLNAEVSFMPRHAVLASAVCLRIAQYANTKLITKIGVDGLVYMAAHHSLLSTDHVDAPFKSTARAVNQLLAGRYRAAEVSENETISRLKAMNQWRKCYDRYRRLSEKRP